LQSLSYTEFGTDKFFFVIDYKIIKLIHLLEPSYVVKYISLLSNFDKGSKILFNTLLLKFLNQINEFKIKEMLLVTKGLLRACKNNP